MTSLKNVPYLVHRYDKELCFLFVYGVGQESLKTYNNVKILDQVLPT
jgi:hypothetical protein